MMAVVKAVSRSNSHGFSKVPQPSIRLVPGEGVDGDAHRGTTTQHLYRMRRDPTQPNLCQVHLLAEEMLDELASRGFTIAPGELGENVLTRGFDLLSLPLGTLIYLGAQAVVQVTGQRTPCRKIDDYRRGLQQHLWGPLDASGKKTRRAGIMSVVLHEGEVHPGDTIRIELPPQPHIALGPV